MSHCSSSSIYIVLVNDNMLDDLVICSILKTEYNNLANINHRVKYSWVCTYTLSLGACRELYTCLRFLMGQTTQRRCWGSSGTKLDQTLSARDLFCLCYSPVIPLLPLRVSNCTIVVSNLLLYKRMTIRNTAFCHIQFIVMIDFCF